MRVRIVKWGNSLAMRIPKPFAEDAGVHEGTDVDVSLIDGKLVATPVGKTYDLRTLLDGVTDRNRHSESDFGSPAGREVW